MKKIECPLVVVAAVEIWIASAGAAFVAAEAAFGAFSAVVVAAAR